MKCPRDQPASPNRPPGGAAEANIGSGSLELSGATAALDPYRADLLEVGANVVDARGTGQGWALSIQDAAASALPATAGPIEVVGARAACAAGSSCTLPLNSLSLPVAIGPGLTRVDVFDAEPGSGMGAQRVRLSLLPPAGQPVALSLSLVSGP